MSFLRALADAGHHVDVAASEVELGAVDNIAVLCGGSGVCPRRRIRLCVLGALKDNSYDVVHAVDDAFIFVSRFARLKRIKTVYEASRCFTGPKGVAPNWFWKSFPKHHQVVERKLLDSADLIFSANDQLTGDLTNISKACRVEQMEDTPVQPMLSLPPIERSGVSGDFGAEASLIVVCRVLHSDRGGLKKILLATRKLLDKVPHALFYFVGPTSAEVGSMAANLDIRNRCSFIPPDKPERYFSVLSVADLVLFVPCRGERYPDAEIMSLLNSSALVVAVHDSAYSQILTEENCVLVDHSTSLMAEGLLRSVQEPLLAFGLVNNARQLIADRYSFSSFKYRVRKAYRELAG
ncbi:MAG: glycosyltransferase [Pontiellaceae bacterium]|nr:glycosyltransferase [Pontiellaceae bacterium]